MKASGYGIHAIHGFSVCRGVIGVKVYGVGNHGIQCGALGLEVRKVIPLRIMPCGQFPAAVFVRKGNNVLSRFLQRFDVKREQRTVGKITVYVHVKENVRISVICFGIDVPAHENFVISRSKEYQSVALKFSEYPAFVYETVNLTALLVIAKDDSFIMSFSIAI